MTTEHRRATNNPSPSGVNERARRAVEKICSDSDFRFLPMRFTTEHDKRVLADIIAAEFSEK